MHRISNLKSVINVPASFMTSAFHLKVQPSFLWSLYRLPETFVFPVSALSMVTTLSLSFYAGINALPTHLPALRYLHVMLSPFFPFERVVDWLKVIGKQLRTFYCLGRIRERQLSPTIWELCPSIEILQLSPRIFWVQVPRGHPIRTLRLSPEFDENESNMVCPECGLVHGAMLKLSAPMEDYAASGIRTLACFGPWSKLHTPMVGRADLRGNIVCLSRQARRLGMRFVDFSWVSFEDYVISQLEIGQMTRRKDLS